MINCSSNKIGKQKINRGRKFVHFDHISNLSTRKPMDWTLFLGLFLQTLICTVIGQGKKKNHLLHNYIDKQVYITLDKLFIQTHFI